MEIHHDKHHGAYVANLNAIAKTNPQLGTSAVPDILGNLNALNDDIKFAVRNNLGGHANHTMFWEIMGPNGGKPEGEVLAAILDRYTLADMSVQDPPLDQIIALVFEESRVKHEAQVTVNGERGASAPCPCC